MRSVITSMVPLDVAVNILSIRHGEDAKEIERLKCQAQRCVERAKKFHMRSCVLDTELAKSRDLLVRAKDEIRELKRRLKSAKKVNKYVQTEL